MYRGVILLLLKWILLIKLYWASSVVAKGSADSFLMLRGLLEESFGCEVCRAIHINSRLVLLADKTFVFAACSWILTETFIEEGDEEFIFCVRGRSSWLPFALFRLFFLDQRDLACVARLETRLARNLDARGVVFGLLSVLDSIWWLFSLLL